MERYLKNKTGITLIALIITVVIMLILAGVAISYFINDGGIFNRINVSSYEYEKQSIIEAVKIAESELEVDNSLGEKHDKNISDLIDKVKENSKINDENYIIIIDDEENKATIIEKNGDIVIDITIDENKEVIVEINRVEKENIANIMKPIITFEIEPDEGTNSETVKIIVTIKEDINGITKLQFPNNEEKVYANQKNVVEEYIVDRNGKYKFTAESGNGNKTTRIINITNTMSEKNIVIEYVGTVKATPGPIDISISYDENVKIGGQDLSNPDKFQYKIGDNDWQVANSSEEIIEVDTNIVITARYFNSGKGFGTTTFTVNNIDKELPKEFDLNLSTPNSYSINVAGNTTDVATEGCLEEYKGIRGYQYQLKDDSGNIIVDWTAEQGDGSYTFSKEKINEIEQGQTYKVNMRAIDKAGNIREATNKEESVTIQTIPDSETSLGISYSKTTPTNENVYVTFLNNSEKDYLTIKYQKESMDGEWLTYTEPIEMAENGIVYGRLYDQTGQFLNTATATVGNIDKVAPTVLLTVEKNGNDLIVTANSIDTELGMSSSPQYSYYLNNNLKKTLNNPTYTMSSVGNSSSNVIKVTTTDSAGNIGEKSVDVSTLVHTHTDDCYNGTKHTHTGSSSSGGGCYTKPNYHVHTGSSTSGGGCYGKANYHSHTSSCYKTASIPIVPLIKDYTLGWSKECPGCGAKGTITASFNTFGYRIDGKTTSTGHLTVYAPCSICGYKMPTVESGQRSGTVYASVISCGKTTSTIDSYSRNCGRTTSTIVSYSRNCGKTANAYYNGNTRVYEECGDMVTKIEPLVATQNVDRRKIDFSIKVTYVDGHTEILNPTTTNYQDSKNYNNEEVILIYNGIVDKVGTTKDFTTTMLLTTK